MQAVGFRAEKDAVQWGLVSGTRGTPLVVKHDVFRAPTDCSVAEALSWFRTEVQNVLYEFHPDAAAVYLVDPEVADQRNDRMIEFLLRRARVEGVLLEACRPILETPVPLEVSSPKKKDPKKSTFLNPDGTPFDWRLIKSMSRRQAIVAAAGLLGMDATALANSK